MIRRTTWIILAVFAVLLGVTWYLQRSKANSKAQTTPTPVVKSPFSVDEKTITGLKIEDNQGNVVSLGRDDKGLWALKEPPTDATDEAQAESGVSQLVSLQVLTTLDTSPATDATGLASPAYTITVDLKDGTQIVGKVGKVTPIGNGYYTQVGSGPVQVLSKTGIDSVVKLLTNPPIQPTPTPSPEPSPQGETTPAAPPEPSATAQP